MPTKTNDHSQYLLGVSDVVTDGVHVPVKVFTRFSQVDVRDGGLNANWKRDIRLLRNATTPLTGTKYKMKFRPVLYSCQWYRTDTKKTQANMRYGHQYQVSYTGMDPASLSQVKAQNAALVRFVKRAQDVSTGFQGQTFLGELGETLRMLRHPTKNLRKELDHYTDLLRKRIKGVKVRSNRWSKLSKAQRAKKLTDIVSDTWLEKSYGLDPLFGDAEAAAKALARRRWELRREVTTVRGYGNDDSTTFTAPQSVVYGPLKFGWSTYTKMGVSVMFYGAVKREVNDDYIGDMSLFGFRPDMFVPTLWEIMPYSFLVDYFTNVGDIINNWSFNRTSLAWVNITVRRYSRREVTDKYVDRSYGIANCMGSPYFAPRESIQFQELHGDMRLEMTKISRSVYNGSLVPTLEFTIPGLDTKWLNIAALGWSNRSVLSSLAKAWRSPRDSMRGLKSGLG